MGFNTEKSEEKFAGPEPGWVTEGDSFGLGQVEDEAIEGFDEGADAFSNIREVEPGTYLMKVGLSTNNSSIGSYKNKEDKAIYYMQLAHQVADPTSPMDRRFIFGMINTQIIHTETGATTAVSSLLKRLGGKPTGKQYTDIQALRQILLTEPMAKGEVDWRFEPEKEYRKDEDGKYINYPRSWKKFPKDPSTNKPLMISRFNPKTGQDDADGNPGKTSAYVKRYLNL